MLSYSSLGYYIKVARIQKNITLEQMSYDTGLSLSTLKRMEAGTDGVKLYFYELACHYLKLDLIQLLSLSEDEELKSLKTIINSLETTIKHYQFKKINDKLLSLEPFLKSSFYTEQYNVTNLYLFYKALYHYSIDQLHDTNYFLKEMKFSKYDLSFNNRTLILKALCHSKNNDVLSSIKIEKQISQESTDTVIIMKSRMNLAKLYFKIKAYPEAYSITLENIEMIKRFRLYDRLQGVYWMKGICEYQLNLDFKHSIDSSILFADAYNMQDQKQLFINTAKKIFNFHYEL